MIEVGSGKSDTERSLEAAIVQVQVWKGCRSSYQTVSGGISNTNFRVTVEHDPVGYFVKSPGRGTEMFIDRGTARAASRQAEVIGIPRQCGADLSPLSRRSAAAADQDRVRHDRGALRAGEATRRLLARGSCWLYRQYQQARAALEAAGLDLVPCFNDPMPGRFERWHVRFIVHEALADIKWSTWALEQNRISTLGFDFYKYRIWKHMRARSTNRDPRWPQFLRAL